MMTVILQDRGILYIWITNGVWIFASTIGRAEDKPKFIIKLSFWNIYQTDIFQMMKENHFVVTWRRLLLLRMTINGEFQRHY